MPGTNKVPPAEAPGGNPDRLNTWKEIAAFLNKGVRTVQRWERNLGLPVHRIHTDAGEIVYALKSEIAEWLKALDGPVRSGLRRDSSGNGQADGKPGPPAGGASVEQPVPPSKEPVGDARLAGSPHRRRRLAASGIAIVLVLTAIGYWIFSRLGPLRAANPVAFSVAGNVLTAFDADERPLWRFDLAGDSGHFSQRLRADRSRLSRGSVEDIDSDGRNEVLFVPLTMSPAAYGLYVLDAGGRLLFRALPERSVRFGESVFAPPFVPTSFVVGADEAGKTVLWLVSVHHQHFPSVVEKLDAGGRRLGEFWSAGHVSQLADARLAGGRVMLVGTVSNEIGGAGLSVIDYARPGGSPPSREARYRCADCPAGSPLAHFLFPANELCRAWAQVPVIDEIKEVAQRAEYAVRLSCWADFEGKREKWHTYYTIDASFRVVGAEYGSDYRYAHAKSESMRKLSALFERDNILPLFPVWRWEGQGLATIAGPEPRSTLPAAGRKDGSR